MNMTKRLNGKGIKVLRGRLALHGTAGATTIKLDEDEFIAFAELERYVFHEDMSNLLIRRLLSLDRERYFFADQGAIIECVVEGE